MSAPLMDQAKAEARYPHGSRARYTLGKCRCFPCRLAITDYESQRNRHKRKIWRLHHVRMSGLYIVRHIETGEIIFRGDRDGALLEQKRRNQGEKSAKPPSELISALRVRRHIARLRSAGVGYKTVAQRSGVSSGVIRRIIAGEIKRTRRSTADRVLAVSFTEPADGANIDATETWELLDRLIFVGYRRWWISTQILGHKSQSLQLSRKRIHVGTARRVREVYAKLWQSNAELRAIDPIVPATVAEARKEQDGPRAVPLSKRDPAIAKRWNALFSGGAL